MLLAKNLRCHQHKYVIYLWQDERASGERIYCPYPLKNLMMLYRFMMLILIK